MPITAEYDREADALYVRLAEGERRRAVELDDVTYVDVDADGRPLGIEVLYPSQLDVRAVATRLSLDAILPAILTAIVASGAPVPPVTITGGGYLASASTTVVEATPGTVVTTVCGMTSPRHQDPPLVAC